MPPRDHTAIPALDPTTDITRRRLLAAVPALSFLAAGISCGDDDDGSGDGATRSIEDYFGPVDVPANPKRIIAAEDITLGNMLAIGVKPIAASVNTNSLPGYLADQMDGIEDVSGEDGLDLEKALALNPDLIITFAGFPGNAWNQENYDRYKAACATFGYQYGYTYIEEILLNLTEVARVLEREKQAEEVIAEYEQRAAELKTRVEKAGLADRPVSVVRLSQSQYSIRIGTSESIAFRALGMAQPEGQRNPDDFSIEFSLENLAVLNECDTVFLYVDDNAASQYDTVTSNAVWQGLEPVKNNRVHRVNSGVWNSINIQGLMRIFDDIEELFIKPAE